MSLHARTRWRIVLSIAAAMVLIAAAITCVRGVWCRHDDGTYRQFGFGFARAAVYVNYDDRSARSREMSRLPEPGWAASTGPVGSPHVEWLPGFVSSLAPVPGWALHIPLWMLFLLLAGPAAWLWWKHLFRPLHQCAKCGYDLRGASSEACPECGQKIAASVAAEPPTRERGLNLWRIRRMFLRPVAGVLAGALILAWASSYFYVYVKVWMFGPEHVMLAGLSSRSISLQRNDYNPEIAHQVMMFMPATTPTYWPRSRWIDAGWLGPATRWQTAWFPQYIRRPAGWVLIIPWWNMAVGAVLFLVVLHLLQSRGHCRHCGYDLRGLPGDICPECGRTFARRVR
jgi:hypothetical protein